MVPAPLRGPARDYQEPGAERGQGVCVRACVPSTSAVGNTGGKEGRGGGLHAGVKCKAPISDYAPSSENTRGRTGVTGNYSAILRKTLRSRASESALPLPPHAGPGAAPR